MTSTPRRPPIVPRPSSARRRALPAALVVAGLLGTLLAGPADAAGAVAAVPAAPSAQATTAQAVAAQAVAAPAVTAQAVAAPAVTAHAVAAPAPPPSETGGPAALPRLVPGAGVRISEVANGGPHSPADAFFELENAGDAPADLTGWGVFRCSAQGLRANRTRSEAAFDGVVLAPGQRVTVAKAGAHLAGGAQPDAVFTQPYAATGFGLVLQDAAGRAVDAIGVYPTEPWPTTSECTAGGNLPSSLAWALGESWQRVDDTGEVSADWVRAPATPGAVNATRALDDRSSGVRVSELAVAGRTGWGDEFVELANLGADDADLGGWRLFTCDAAGRLSSERPAVALPDRALPAGSRWAIAGPDAEVPGDTEVVARVDLRLPVAAGGVLLVDGDGARVDGVAVSGYADSACQPGTAKLPPLADHRTGESWQRVADDGDGESSWVIAPRTPGAPNARAERSVRTEAFDYGDPRRPTVAVSELGTDPDPAELPEGLAAHAFVELGNFGDEAVDLSGWRLVACGPSGARGIRPLATVPDGTTLAAGATWTAARRGSAAAGAADAEFATGLNFRGSGVWVEDASGRRVDSVGVYLANEMDFSVERPSLCTKGVSLTTFAPDRLRGETYRRVAFTGVDSDDFAAGRATPGRVDAAGDRADVVVSALAEASQRASATARASSSSTRAAAASGAGGGAVAGAAVVQRDGGAPAGAVRAADVSDTVLSPTTAVRGVAAGPLVTRDGPVEVAVDPADPGALTATASGTEWPYLRLAVPADAIAGRSVVWRGTVTPRVEVVLSAWDASAGRWQELDRVLAPAASGGAPPAVPVELVGAPTGVEASGPAVDLLVQVVPRGTIVSARVGHGFEDPGAYDLSIAHLTDTQYLTEAHPEAYAEAVSWIVANRDARKIAFAAHTGDLVQNWVDPDQSEALARREFATASRMQAVLDDAGVPNSVLPGNHDSKRGMTVDLFNEAFPPSRYEQHGWYGDSIAPGDNSASWSGFSAAGAPFLVLSLPYAYGERELAWAEGVVAEHPDANVVIATHEHVRPKEVETAARRSVDSRWVSRGGELWDRVIAPNPNVVLVLSGHFHGIGTLVTEDAGGIAGHTVVEMVADYQEFRTHTGERATAFERLLQVDLAGGAIAVDTYSGVLGVHESHPYDYVQFVPETGDPTAPSSMRPWQVVAAGVQGRYTAADDEFLVDGVSWRFEKLMTTAGISAR
ncbi:lamin tail domain-containing protein [Agromyces sp. MMS24-K17]|uniref:lamin tail domain-containing protein n=1 Tax=Agromyces sp. MMS24-K17 TaxID=3372850 RepID=UPI0037545BE7